MARQLRIWAVTTGILALLGVPLGLLWAWSSPRPSYIILDGGPVFADPESQVLIAADGRLAIMCAVAGLVTGALAYVRAGKRNEVALVLAMCTGGMLGSCVAWAVGHRFGLSHFQDVVRTAAVGTEVEAPLSLGAPAVITLWPLIAIALFGLLESLDLARRLAPPDGGQPAPGEFDEVTRREFDLQSSAPGADVDRREP